MITVSRRTLLGLAVVLAADPLMSAPADKPRDRSAFLDLFAERQTVRRYKPDPVPREHLRRISITPIGVPERWPEPKPKRRLEEMVAYETLEGHPQLAPLPYNP